VYVRVVRFTDVSAEKLNDLLSRIGEVDGPPPGVPSKAIQVLHDENQGTALAIQVFDTLDDMRAGDQVLGAMDPAQTPGTRVSVDMCELKLERRASSAG
jgi:hypothetical protein